LAQARRSVFGAAPEELIINYQAHAGQLEVSQAIRDNFALTAAAAIVELICSRGWGKTLYLVCEVLVPFLHTNPNAKVMWVAPTYQIAASPIDDVFRGVNEETGERWVPEFDDKGNRVWEFANTAAGPVLRWFNGATVAFKSADSPESIVSRGYNLIIIDEAALIEERVFTQQILGTARKEGIKIFMISSPRGKQHWTYKVFCKGQDPKETNYLSLQQPWTKNPHFNKTLASLIKDLPDWLYRQEYLAEFIEDGDVVFRGVDAILDGLELAFEGQQQEWEAELTDIVVPSLSGDRKVAVEDRRYVVSMDLAKAVDYTVITVMDLDTGQIVYYRRMNKTDYREVLKFAAELCKRFNSAELIFDKTGVGSGLADFLNNYDVTAVPFTFTNESKNDIVTKLALAIEHQNIRIPNIVTMKNELAVFTYKLTRTGKMSYGAPSGFHDDIVMSLAMANYYRSEHSADPGEVSILEEVIKMNNRMSGADPGSFREYMENDND
jgi:hypothetical protein